MKFYRKFKKKHRLFHIALMGLAIILFWRGIWELLNRYLFPGDPLLSNLICLGVAFGILYLDGFHLKELE